MSDTKVGKPSPFGGLDEALLALHVAMLGAGLSGIAVTARKHEVTVELRHGRGVDERRIGQMFSWDTIGNANFPLAGHSMTQALDALKETPNERP